MFGAWHASFVAHMHLIAITRGLGTAHYKKLNLTDAELALFYQELRFFKIGLVNWKRHNAAWLLAYICGVHPGSFTVCPGCEKGANLGDGEHLHEIDDTLRWDEVHSMRIEGVTGIGVRIMFQCLKGQRNPSTRSMVQGQRSFIFLSVKSERYGFDLSAIFIGLAWSRGLFPHNSIEELFSDENQEIPKDPEVNQQAVLVAADQANSIIPTEDERTQLESET